MMFTAQTKILNERFQYLKTVAEKGDSLKVYYDSERDAITFFLRNGNESGLGQTIKTFLRCGDDVTVPDKDGEFTVPFDLAAAALYACRFDAVTTVNKTKNGVEFVSDANSTRINETTEIFEPDVQTPAWTTTIPSGELAEAFSFCAPIAGDSTHFALEGVFFCVDESQNCLCAIGTDGRCVGKYVFKGIVPTGTRTFKTVPMNNAKRAASICSSVLGDCEISANESFFALKTSEFEYSTQLLDGRVPNVNAVVYETQMGASVFTCKAEGLWRLVQTFRKVCQDKDKNARLKFTYGALEMTSKSEASDWKSKIQLDGVEEESEALFASEFLTHIASMFDSDQDELKIYLRNNEKPVGFFADDKVLVVMPLVK